MSELEEYLNGEKLPSLDIIYRLSRIAELDMKFFFTPNFYGSDYLIQNDLIRFSILKHIKPKKAIGNIKNVNKFIGSVLYQIANKIVYLNEIISDNHNSWEEYPRGLSARFKGKLAHQYYKLLEQIPGHRYDNDINQDYNKGFTMQELIIRKIDERIITETIQKIIISKNEEPIVIAFFDEEIENKIVYSKTYDEENMRMVFCDEKLKNS